MNDKHWYEAFITKGMNYVLLDDNGDIRATGFNIVDITKAKIQYRFGKIHKMEFDGITLKIGELIE